MARALRRDRHLRLDADRRGLPRGERARDAVRRRGLGTGKELRAVQPRLQVRRIRGRPADHCPDRLRSRASAPQGYDFRLMAIPYVDVKAQYAPLIPELKDAFAQTLESGRFIF